MHKIKASTSKKKNNIVEQNYYCVCVVQVQVDVLKIYLFQQ